MSRPVALLDVDGVLADFVGAYLKLLGSQTDRWFAREQVTHFDIGASLGLTPDEAAAMKRAIGSHPGLADVLDVYPGAVDGVRALETIADVYIVTSPWNSNPTWTHDREWLRRNFGISHSRVIHAAAKHPVCGDVFVDDKTETLRTWRERQPGVAIQWHTPHNQLDGWEGVSTQSWDDVLRIVEGARS